MFKKIFFIMIVSMSLLMAKSENRLTKRQRIIFNVVSCSLLAGFGAFQIPYTKTRKIGYRVVSRSFFTAAMLNIQFKILFN